jgi:hypothetical protein
MVGISQTNSIFNEKANNDTGKNENDIAMILKTRKISARPTQDTTNLQYVKLHNILVYCL